MKIKHLFVAALLLIVGTAATLAQGMQMPPIPVDKAVRIGKLDNGLTYYIRQNGYPEHHVAFYIAQRVGSLQENDDQRGLAHFLEHMAFNGSEHYKGNDLIEYLRSIGVEFGADLNAYTSVDQTVYYINNVPSARIESLDSCLLVLKDWSNGLLLEQDEIDKERGVVHDEWRLRTSPFMRMLERNLEKLYPGSKYGQRMPIGKMKIIDNFQRQTLVDYYHKWYHPEHQAIIVVGDVDVDRTEAKIKELFGGIKASANAAHVVEEQVPDNGNAIIVIDKDKEQQADIVMLLFKHNAMPKTEKGNLGYMLQQYAKTLMANMMNNRLREKAQEADCPFVQATANDGVYLISTTKDAFTGTVVPKPGKTVEAVAALTREIMRAVKFGFTATEYERAKAEYMSELEKTYTNKDKRENDTYGQIYIANYINNEPMPSIEDEYMIMQQLTPQLPVDLINKMMPTLVSQTDSNLVVYAMLNEKEGATYPTADELKKAIDGVHAEQLTAYVDNVKNEPLIANLPAKGKIVSEKENKTLGYKELTLSNGARVLLKKTDFKDDEVKLDANSKGGKSLYDEADYANLKLFDEVISYSGLGGFSSTELKKALAGKQANADLTLQTLHETVSGSSTPKDMETMFQMVYLYFTDITKDEKSYTQLMSLLETALKNKSLSPDQAVADSLIKTHYAHNPRFAPVEVSDLKNVNYDRILQIAKERTANAADFTFTIVGNYDEAAIRPLIEQYIASLPAKGKKEEYKPVTTYAQGENINKFNRKMETPKAKAFMYWYNNKMPYTLENDVLADAAGQVLSMVYLKEIREEQSAAYSVGAYGAASVSSVPPFTYIFAYCPMNPEKSDIAIRLMNEEIANLANKVDAEMLNKVKELMLKRADENAKKNDHWISVMQDYDEYGVDTETNYKNLVSALTPEKVSKFVKNIILGGGNSVKVIMLPETENK